MSESRKAGRPPKIDRDVIAAVVIAQGPDRATMRSVADALGMSVPGLYHHVRGQQELRTLAAEYILAEAAPPVHVEGEHWAHYLRRCAWFIRRMCARHPSLLEHMLVGALDDDTRLAWISDGVEVLLGQDFDPAQAQTAWSTVTMLAVGNAVDSQREKRASAAGGGWSARARAFLTASTAQRNDGLRALVSSAVDPFTDDAFERQLDIAIAGISARFGFSATPASTGPADGGVVDEV
ncbi:TetR family transcriptional regulator [Mycolicibacterium sp. Y3]